MYNAACSGMLIVCFLASVRIIRDFETISEQLVLNPESATKAIPLGNIAFSSTMVSQGMISPKLYTL